MINRNSDEELSSRDATRLSVSSGKKPTQNHDFSKALNSRLEKVPES